ncbi:hypothetical protein D3C79_808170 [compost metagenome]
MLLLAIQTLDAIAAQQCCLPLLQVLPAAIGQAGAHAVLEHHNAGGVGLLAHQETGAQCLHLPLRRAHPQRPERVCRDLDQQLSAAQYQQPLVGIEVQVDGTATVEAQAAAIGQGEAAPLATGGVQVGQPVLCPVAAPAAPGCGSSDAQASQGP